MSTAASIIVYDTASQEGIPSVGLAWRVSRKCRSSLLMCIIAHGNAKPPTSNEEKFVISSYCIVNWPLSHGNFNQVKSTTWLKLKVFVKPRAS